MRGKIKAVSAASVLRGDRVEGVTVVTICGILVGSLQDFWALLSYLF